MCRREKYIFLNINKIIVLYFFRQIKYFTIIDTKCRKAYVH